MKYFTKQYTAEIVKKRITIFIIGVSFLFFLLICRLWYLQIIQGSEFETLSENNRIRLLRVKSPRGLIFDRNGQILVTSRPFYTASIIKEDIANLKDSTRATQKLAENLSRVINIPESIIIEKIQKSNLPLFKPIKIKTDLSWKEVATLEEHSLDIGGVVVEVEPKRYYIYKNLASHLLGYMGEISEQQLRNSTNSQLTVGDMVGKAGIEKEFDNYLIGKDGGRQVEVNAKGREIKTLGEKLPVAGTNITITIDLQLQLLAEELMKGKKGSIIAMDPQNGEILTMVSTPSFNPNLFASGISIKDWQELLNDPFNPLYNRAIQSHYPPGSIFKIIVSCAALETKAISEGTSFYCNGKINIGGWKYSCWKKQGHGTVSLHRAIVQSCNVFFYQVGNKTGIENIAYYAKQFGFSKLTGIKLANEEPGIIPNSEWKEKTFRTVWFPGETISASIGQGYISVTPIQLANFISCVANGGTLYKPIIIKKIVDNNDQNIYNFEPVVLNKVLVSQSNLNYIRNALYGVVNENGTGTMARLNKIKVAGKTGTAQVVQLADEKEIKEENIPEKFRDHAWFVCYAPAENPKIALVILVEHGGHGGSACAPIAKELIKNYLKVEN
ncbi:MAG: penicillin-binding protein 2 [bacterium]